MSERYFLDKQFEFSPHIICPINCKVCIIERIKKSYTSGRYLTLPFFKDCLHKIPKAVNVVFGGFSEPFINPHFTKMLNYAHDNGYTVAVFTTLLNANPFNIQQIKHIPFVKFLVHLPDPVNCVFHYRAIWGETLHSVAVNIPNAEYMTMNDNFVSCGMEYLDDSEHEMKRLRRVGRCLKFDNAQFLMMPNGEVYPCCRLVGFPQYILGDMKTDSYEELTAKFKKSIPYDICRFCVGYYSIPKYLLYRLKPRLMKYLRAERCML